MKNILLISMLLFLSFNQEAVNAQNINKPNIAGPAGLGVNSYSGSLFTQRQDLYIPCRGFPIDLTFTYNSSTTGFDLGYGPGWSMTYSMICKPEGSNVIIRTGDGRKDIYTFNGSGYVAPAGIFDTLTEYMPGKYKLVTKHGISYFFDNLIHHRLTSIVDPNNNTLTVAYTDSLPTTITDPSGRSISLNYTGGHLNDITDMNKVQARQVTYIYDTAGNPVTVTGPIGNSVHYTYDEDHNMVQYTDPLANQFNISYQNCVNVDSITSSLNSISISYDTALITTTVTETVNSVIQSTSYKFTLSGNLEEKIGNCCGFHQQYSYDARNNMIQKTDANGNVSNYTYDAKGNLLTETDPLGGTRTYIYEPVFNLVTSITDKRGNITTNMYDTHGNLLEVHKSLGIIEYFTYDSYGNLLAETDGRGFTTTFAYNLHGDKTLITFPGGSTNGFTYDNVGNRLSFTDCNGNTQSYSYDMLNRMLQLTDALSHTTTYIYDARGSVTSVTDALGHVTTYTYDALNRKTSITTPAGTSHSTYDEEGNMLTFTDNNGNVTQYAYDTRNRLVTETDALNHSVTYTYDNNGNRISETDKRGNITSNVYDALNRVVQVTDALSNLTTYTYDANSNRISMTDANGHVTTYVYDALNRKIQLQRPSGTIIYTYDANNNRTSVTDANGNTHTTSFDSRNSQSVITDALSNTFTFTYDVQGNNTSTTDRNGNTTQYQYDALNRIIKTINPEGEADSVVYDAADRTVLRIHPTGNFITFTYDAANRLVSSSDLVGTIDSATYDANSNTLTQTDGNGHTTSYIYDALNRMVTSTDALSNTATTTYDNNSNVISRDDRNGHVTNYVYDALNRKTQTTYPEGNINLIAYDAVGNTISRTDDNGHATVYAYDSNNRLLTITYANDSVESYTYDAKGNMVTRTDNAGNVTIYSYDALDRLISKNYPGTNDDGFTYDAGGRMLTAGNNHAAISWSYDDADRILSENMNGHTTAYTYNIQDKKRLLLYPGGRSIEENYDFRFRLSEIKEAASQVFAFTYDDADRLLNRIYSNGTTATYTYNNNNWVTSLNHSGSSTLVQFNYGFDNEGNRLFAEKTHHSTNSEQYTYDDDDRVINYKEGTLSSGTIPSPVTQTQYNYDGAGNRTIVVKDAVTTTYTANAVNEYSAVISGGTTIPIYDANGNTTSDGVHSYAYDFENRLISVDGGATATYKYDALGRRIQKVTIGGTINYYYDGSRIIEERNAGDAITATCIWGTWIDEILSMQRDGNDYYYHQNSLGSVAAVTDETGAVAERYEYDAFGLPSFFNGSYSPLSSTAIGNTWLFTGREYDVESGLYHYRARYYNPVWGRFGQPDPIGIWGDPRESGNGYSYVSNSAINFLDPYGNIRSLKNCKPVSEQVLTSREHTGQYVRVSLEVSTEGSVTAKFVVEGGISIPMGGSMKLAVETALKNAVKAAVTGYYILLQINETYEWDELCEVYDEEFVKQKVIHGGTTDCRDCHPPPTYVVWENVLVSSKYIGTEKVHRTESINVYEIQKQQVDQTDVKPSPKDESKGSSGSGDGKAGSSGQGDAKTGNNSNEHQGD